MKNIILIIIVLFAFVHAQDLALEARAHRYADSVVVGVKALVPKGFHLYANPLGPGIGRPLNLYVNKTSDGDGVTWTETLKSSPKRYDPPMGEWVWAYKDEAYFFVRGVGSSGAYEILLDALICKTSCVPIQKSVAFSIPDISDKPFPWHKQLSTSEPMPFDVGLSDVTLPSVTQSIQLGIDLGDSMSLKGGLRTDPSVGLHFPEESEDPLGDWNYTPIEERRDYNLLTAILFALLAGLAMNLTPCIFPMLGVRVLSFAQSARESRRRAVVRSVMFSQGIVAVFILLASLASFAGFSWGQQFQNPTIMVGIISVIFLFALGMFDFYTLSAPSSVGNVGRDAGATLLGDFAKGAAATVMATPCAGPFLGALLAWALLQPPPVIFAVFTMMGVGMSIPYILLSSSSKLMKLLPKPGRWIEDFKHAMGFFLLIFAVLLMRSLDPSLTLTAVGIALSILIAASVNRRYAPFGESSLRRLTVGLLSLALLALGVVLSVMYLHTPTLPSVTQTIQLSDDRGERELWLDFSPTILKDAHASNRNVVLNFTASWCTNCKLNYTSVLNSEPARRLYQDKNVLLLTADITNKNPAAETLLHHLGSRSIPFVAIFPADDPSSPIVMRDIISKDKYFSTLGALRGLPPP